MPALCGRGEGIYVVKETIKASFYTVKGRLEKNL
jgi:hypothetical protein